MKTEPDGLVANSAPGAGRARRGRTLLIAVAIGVVVFAASAVRSFASHGGFAADVVGHTIACGRSERCIPGLHSDDVVDALEAEGHTCDRDLQFGGAACRLEIGATLYESLLQTAEGDGRVTRVQARVSRPDETGVYAFPDDAPPPKGLVPYLSWIATVPLGDDQAAVSEVTTWLERQLDRGDNADVQYGDYRYEVAIKGPGEMSLVVDARESKES